MNLYDEFGNIVHPQPGDAIFARTTNLYGFLIRAGQALRWWKYRKWNHVALFAETDAQGQMWVLQMARRCERVCIEDVAPGGTLKWAPMPGDLDNARVVAYANKRVGTKYAVLVIASIFVNLFLPDFLRLDFQHGNSLICSGFVARSWEHGGWNCPTDPFQITPAGLDAALEGTKVTLHA